MLEFKGTKGEWYCDQAVVGGQLQSNFNITNENRFIHTPIAKCFSQSMNLEEAKANAKLIAAAPEMLETLKHIVEYWNGDRNDQAMFDALNHILEQAESVIVKAMNND